MQYCNIGWGKFAQFKASTNIKEILETFSRKYLVMCELFCNFAVAMRGMKAPSFASHGRTGGRGEWAQNSDAPDNVELGLMKGETNHAYILHTLSGQPREVAHKR